MLRCGIGRPAVQVERAQDGRPGAISWNPWPSEIGCSQLHHHRCVRFGVGISLVMLVIPVQRRRHFLEPFSTTVFLTLSNGQVPTIPREKPQRQFKFKPKSMLVLSQEFYDQNASLQNDLVGPFHNPSKIKGIQYCGPQEKWRTVGRPIVRSMSTFEEYLERTVNTIRGDSEIAFHPSQV